jgi:1,2-diacylglycerol 3-beta-glucosyltransferase
MQENSWQENDSYGEPISSLLSELSDSFTDSLTNINNELDQFSDGFVGRRRKAALMLTMIWGGTIALHLSTYGFWLVFALTTVMGFHALRVLFARPIPVPTPLTSENLADYPFVSVLVAAKNEEAVIGSLVENLCTLDYPASRYDLWIIDDNSTDRTPKVLDQLQTKYSNLRVVRRSANALGGKSGALNQVWTTTQADVIAVFDADAKVPKDLLRRVLPLFNREPVGAVQVRKAISNGQTNGWTRGQVAEMAIDSYFQQQRIAIGGIGELRGNGQFVRRTALERCGGWNEETITDDLDLTLRLHLDQWDIDFLMMPAVGEEGVVNAVGLWHQRNRWAEGGYQRYLDYWRLIAQNRMGTAKTFDLVMFLLTQYILPTAAVPDFVMAIMRNSLPMLWPVTSLALMLSFVGMSTGLRRAAEPQNLSKRARLLNPFTILVHTLFGNLYMLHWIPVMASTTARMAVRPKQLKWVKTVHLGDSVEC